MTDPDSDESLVSGTLGPDLETHASRSISVPAETGGREVPNPY